MPDETLDITRMNDPQALLVCARLYLRRGKRRLQQKYSAACMAALYDAVLFGMRYYVARHQGCALYVKNIDLWDAASLFQALTRAGVFDDPLKFNRFTLLVERALWQPSSSFDVESTLAEAERMLAKLGVISLNNRVQPTN